MDSRSLLSLSPPLSYEEALDFWFGRINYEQRSPQPSDLKLDRMRTLLSLLGNPQEKLRIIHVAGSKGKGSTSAMLDAILRVAGYRTGLFTSPHLCRVEERIQVNGSPIGPQELATLMQEIRTAIGRMEDTPAVVAWSPNHATGAQGDLRSEASHGRETVAKQGVSGQAVTFFEVATALGFVHFARQGVDVAVIEVGLGGRFDSTNVCVPLASVITSISFDHTQQLGDRLASIAMEKAGIVKPGRPTISGVTAPEARQVIESICRERNSNLDQWGRDFNYEYQPGVVDNAEARNCPSQVRISSRHRVWPVMKLGLLGEHQAANAAVAVTCVERLREQGLSIDDQAVQAGMTGVNWPARMEVLRHEPLVVLDCAHNVASAQALVDTLRTSFPPTKSECQVNGHFEQTSEVLETSEVSTLEKRLLIFAGSSDKDLAGILQVLTPPFDHVFLTRYSHSSRAAPVEGLAEILRQQSSVPFTLRPTPVEAWRAACDAAGPDDLICITGSVFLAGELRPVVLGE